MLSGPVLPRREVLHPSEKVVSTRPGKNDLGASVLSGLFSPKRDNFRSSEGVLAQARFSPKLNPKKNYFMFCLFDSFVIQCMDLIKSINWQFKFNYIDSLGIYLIFFRLRLRLKSEWMHEYRFILWCDIDRVLMKLVKA